MARIEETAPIPSDWDIRIDRNGLCLFVVEEGHPPEVHPLPREGQVTLGRGDDQHIQLGREDVHISRRHATLHVGAEAPFLLTNLSRNGTRVGPNKLKPNQSEPVYLWQRIDFSRSTYGWVQERAATLRPWQVHPHERFMERLEQARVRAVDARAPLSVARLVVDWVPEVVVQQELAQATIATDVVGAYAPPREYEIVFVDTSPAETRERMDRLAGRLRDYGGEVRFSIAGFPDDGRTAPALLHRATDALRVHAVPVGSAFVAPAGRMAEVYAQLERIAAAPAQVCVLILGETGVGKGVVARRLHDLSSRNKGEFVALNLSAIPEATVEAELFGHEKGAFTDAKQAHKGLFLQAGAGTVFLDEIGELPQHLQVKLLTVLDERAVRPLHSEGPPVSIEARFISATNRDLKAEVEAGRFRADLYWRLKTYLLHIPPLRERVDEIEPLTRMFIKDACGNGVREPVLSREALEALKRHRWPGNIRQLKSVVQSATWICRDGVIRAEDLEIYDEPASPVAGADARTLQDDIDEVQKRRLIEAIERHRGNQSAVASELGIARGTLIKLLKKLGLYVPVRPRGRKTPPGGMSTSGATP